jgi:Transposase DDE domain
LSGFSKPTGYKKKLYAFRPDAVYVETHRTKRRNRREPCNPASLERGVRQLLANKVSGTMVGLWLLIPEHLRLGTWDLLSGWTQMPGTNVQPRLALQLVHEAALCVTGVRQGRTLSQKGFELANGLPFVASDYAIHELLQSHTVAEAESLQVALGRIRRASGHYRGNLLAIDPHHMRSYTKRQTRRHRHKKNEPAIKTSQTFFCLDAETGQPFAFTVGSAARTVTQATPALLKLAEAILQPAKGQALALADTEHCTAELFDQMVQQTRFDLLTPQSATKLLLQRLRNIPESDFQSPWVGLAMATRPYNFTHGQLDSSIYQIVQRCGVKTGDYYFKSFLSTRDVNAVQALIEDYPKRWHVEEFFNANQALGWNRAGTLNLNIRYGQMTMALMAQASIHQFRQRLRPPYNQWDAGHLAKDIFKALDGDIRVNDNTIIVTYYNAPLADQLREQYEHLPEKLANQKISPHIPWLYDFKLDFRFR